MKNPFIIFLINIKLILILIKKTCYTYQNALGDLCMAVSYARLWKLLIDKGMNKSQLRDAAGISTNAIAKLGRNETVSLETLDKICCALDCELEDIIELIRKSERNKK